jgi:hypothetical protein
MKNKKHLAVFAFMYLNAAFMFYLCMSSNIFEKPEKEAEAGIAVLISMASMVLGALSFHEYKENQLQ